MILASALFTLLHFGNPVSNTNPTTPVLPTAAAATTESEYVVGVFVVYEDDTYETIEEKAVPTGLEFEVVTSDGEKSIQPGALNHLLESRFVTNLNGKKVKRSISYLSGKRCSREYRNLFINMCYSGGVPFNCLSPDAKLCSCVYNAGFFPCDQEECSKFWIWCNNN